nr:MAG TPA: hypothetical protein [Caudoviricetes sp.]
MRFSITTKEHDNYLIINLYINNILVFSFYNFKMYNGKYKYDLNNLNINYEIDENDIIFNRLRDEFNEYL